MTRSTETSYYTRQTGKLVRGHARFFDIGRPAMTARYGESFTETTAREAQEEFARLIPEIPYIGGKSNSFTELMIQAASLLAIYRVMKASGKTVEEIGDFVHQMAEAWVNRYPPLARRLMGRLYMSKFWRKRSLEKARASQERRFPGNFVYEVVEGDGETYAWGIDYLECGLVKFFHQQGADDFMPYACRLDYLLFPALGIDLQRKGTIAQGCTHCDFRFRMPKREK
jgi:hypothetical protein